MTFRGQNWYIERLEKLNYSSDELGMCFGIAQMAVQAILAEDLQTFTQRLKIIKDIPLDKFRDEIDRLKAKRQESIEKVKKNLDDKKPLNPAEENKLLSLTAVQLQIIKLKKSLESLMTEGKLDKKNFDVQFEKRKKQLLKNANFNQRIEEQIAKDFDHIERIKLTIPAFFEGISLYQSPSSLFPHTSQLDAPKLLTPILTPQLLEDAQAGHIRLTSFFGIYTENELTEHFESFSKITREKKIMHPIAITLSSNKHIVTIKYDAVRNKWCFIDASNLPGLFDLNTTDLIKQIITSFPRSEYVALQSHFFTGKAQSLALKECMSDWQKLTSWKETHAITPEKAKAKVGSESWLFHAVFDKDVNLAKSLLAANADPNHWFGGYTILGIALHHAIYDKKLEMLHLLLKHNVDPNQSYQEGNPLIHVGDNLELTKLLLNAKADPNYVTSSGKTPLIDAIEKGLDKKVDLLLTKADPNQSTEYGQTPLLAAIKLAAIKKNNTEMVFKLLAAGANPNENGRRRDKYGKSVEEFNPLQVAVQGWNFEIVKALLDAKADPNTITSPNQQTILEFAIYINAPENIVNELIKANANVNGTAQSSPLKVAICNRNMDKLKMLLSAQADPTPVMVIAENWKNAEAVQFLKIAENCKTMLAETNNKDSPRAKAIEKCLQNCMQAADAQKATEIFEGFEKMDGVLQKLKTMSNASSPLHPSDEKINDTYKKSLQAKSYSEFTKSLNPITASTTTQELPNIPVKRKK